MPISPILLTLAAATLGAPVPPPVDPPAFPNGAVAADHEIASRAGVEILRAGGNAVDAAVAASFTLSVVRPQSCGIGGGGFMVIHLRDHPRHGTLTTTVNYRETCPRAYGPDFYENDPDPDASSRGGKSIAVPGTVAGLLYTLEKYGTRPRAEVLAPAIRAAEQGFAADKHYVDSVKEVMEWFEKSPERPARSRFFYERYLNRGAVKVGDLIRVPEQAAALRLIVEHGADGFYKGPVAEAVLRAAAGDGGLLSQHDLDSFTVAEAPPLVSNFMGRNLSMMPPPSSGGIVVAQVTEMLELRRDELGAAGHNSVAYAHLVVESLKHAFADRAAWLGDPAFVEVPIGTLLDPAYIRARADLFNPAHTLGSDQYGTRPSRPSEVPQLPDDHGTSHLSAVDRWGNAVACTETVNLIFGSLIAVPEYGFVLNDEMDDFSTRPGKPNAFGLIQSERNAPAPGKRPLSSMTPMIATDERGVLLVAGGSGGPRIITGTLEAALNVLVFDMPAMEAVSRPRFHHQWKPDRVGLEDPLRGTPLESGLKALGHSTERRDMVGTVQLVRRAASGRGWDAASDPRKGGVAAGY